jgi:flagellar biosynthesis/type III secretory pathway M-ring protein FliF/YscJ
MGGNEIRLRKQRLNPGRIARHRDYAELMRRHQRRLKAKQLLLVVVYIIVVLILILLSFIAVRIEKTREGKKTTAVHQWSDHTSSSFVDASNAAFFNNQQASNHLL